MLVLELLGSDPSLEMKTEEALLLTESPMRSVLKGFTWRLVATFTTIVIVYCITGEQAKALQIGAIEFVAKFAVYYLHERAWVRISFGQGMPKPRKNAVCI